MSIQSIRLRLATLQEAIPGIRKAYAQLPRGVVKEVDLPLFLNFVRDATYDVDVLGSSDIGVTRVFPMWLLVRAAASGDDGEAESVTEQWIETVVNYFMSRPSLNNLVGVMGSVILSDTGPKKMAWPGSAANPAGTYWGVEFRLQVTEYIKRTFESNE